MKAGSDESRSKAVRSFGRRIGNCRKLEARSRKVPSVRRDLKEALGGIKRRYGPAGVSET